MDRSERLDASSPRPSRFCGRPIVDVSFRISERGADQRRGAGYPWHWCAALAMRCRDRRSASSRKAASWSGKRCERFPPTAGHSACGGMMTTTVISRFSVVAAAAWRYSPRSAAPHRAEGVKTSWPRPGVPAIVQLPLSEPSDVCS